MGRGLKAGRLSKKDRNREKISRAIRQYEAEDRKRFVESVRMKLEKEVSEILSYHHNIDMVAVLFALRDEFGFGRERLIRAIRKTCDHSERMLRDKADVDEMLAILEAETGLKEEDMVWDVEIETEI